VVGNPLAFIGSGPTVEEDDHLPLPRAAEILGQYDIATQLGRERWQRLAEALRQTRFGKEPAGNRVRNYIIGDVRQAAVAAQVRAMQLGFVTQLLTVHLEGEAREIGRVAAALARDLAPGHCLISGGETTVTVRGSGSGGRSQELALAAAIRLSGSPRAVVASFGTDGEDGPTTAAGAAVTGQTATLAWRMGLDAQQFLDNNDSYQFFRQLDERGIADERSAAEEQRGKAETAHVGAVTPDPQADRPPSSFPTSTSTSQWQPHHIVTGPTGTNVNDLLFILRYEV
jgi:hydroxypyruvate reductase